MPCGCFVSDLHLFSPRSMAVRWMPAIEAACQDSQLIVLGGDIFDFRWATLGGHQATLQAVENWLTKLLNSHPHATIVYILGNHDSHPDLHQLLNRLGRKHANLLWHAEHYQVADCFFCHGDVLDAGSPRELTRYRRKFQHHRQASRTAHRLYDAAVAMRLHRTLPKLFHRPRATCQRLNELLAIDAPVRSDSKTTSQVPVRRVFFGHTHVPIYELPLGSIHYYNPGAALRHMNFAPITFEFQP